jgi:hypothetical protein
MNMPGSGREHVLHARRFTGKSSSAQGLREKAQRLLAGHI